MVQNAGQEPRNISRHVAPEASVVNLLRSCDFCVARGGEWWSASDLDSMVCSNVSHYVDPSLSWVQTVVPSCHAPGQRFLSLSFKINDVNPFQPAFRYSTSFQCSHRSSFCSSIGMSGANCVAMIVLIMNMPLTALFMRLSHLARENEQLDTNSTWLRAVTPVLLTYMTHIQRQIERICPATKQAFFGQNLVAEFILTYMFWPVQCVFLSWIVVSLIVVSPLIAVTSFLDWLLTSCRACCGRKNEFIGRLYGAASYLTSLTSGARAAPDNNSAASDGAMVALPTSESRSELSSETAIMLHTSDTAFRIIQ